MFNNIANIKTTKFAKILKTGCELSNNISKFFNILPRNQEVSTVSMEELRKKVEFVTKDEEIKADKKRPKKKSKIKLCT